MLKLVVVFSSVLLAWLTATSSPEGLPAANPTAPPPTTKVGSGGKITGRTSEVKDANSRRHKKKKKSQHKLEGDANAVVNRPDSPAPEICFGDTYRYACIPAPKTKKKPPKGPNPSASLREVVANLKLPDPTPRFGPDPSVNEWNMLAVGFPIWLWTDQPTRITTTAHHDGLTFQLTATWQSTTFNMGDGHTTTCTTTTIYPPHLDKPGRPSPTCGYIYEVASPAKKPYTVTADTHWQINWAAADQTGTLNTTYTGNRTLDVGELQSLVTG
ncbi:hypothetical protein [Propionicimonas sp.]|uniref:hypothetical protein n=1 Tax=Propionicimonas sp. TaxID=1955623 RepID=UPI0018388783|nr:hypothetical protein [Propionicimonas sp.]MBU3977157.1 hypothetical protein [Actinomycetota bacterium]MBA3020724.1 hypothetical protein [Propionicimonas sp.]MBU3985097.1 hypothetical protein [Actinomycetota bacterium]MBU4006946.1 hypothetical protein [Actinomycetota bacterium]MBU4064699.1 hypothetical protein [Actinomycetota bacterium]